MALVGVECMVATGIVKLLQQQAAHLSVGKAFQEVGFAAAVGSYEAISTPDGQLNRAVLYELYSVEAQTEAINLDVSGCGPRCQDTCDGPL